MSWVRDVYEALRKIILMDQRLDQATEHMRQLALSHEELEERVARLEGKFELFEAIVSGKTRQARKIPPGE